MIKKALLIIFLLFVYNQLPAQRKNYRHFDFSKADSVALAYKGQKKGLSTFQPPPRVTLQEDSGEGESREEK